MIRRHFPQFRQMLTALMHHFAAAGGEGAAVTVFHGVGDLLGNRHQSLPLFPEMTEGDVDRVCTSLGRVLRSRAA